MKQIDYYEDQIHRMDHAIETIRQEINTKIVELEKIKKDQEKTKEKEKKSFEYNIKKVRECIQKRSTGNIFDIFEHIANSLEIIRDEIVQNENGQKNEQKS